VCGSVLQQVVGLCHRGNVANKAAVYELQCVLQCARCSMCAAVCCSVLQVAYVLCIKVLVVGLWRRGNLATSCIVC